MPCRQLGNTIRARNETSYGLVLEDGLSCKQVVGWMGMERRWRGDGEEMERRWRGDGDGDGEFRSLDLIVGYST